MITLYSSAALQLVTLRYKYCYLLTAICVVGVLLLGKAAGDKSHNTSVMEMVMAGSIISQGLNVFTQYYMYELEDEDLELYQELELGTYLQTDATSMIVFTVVMAIAILPMLALRFRFNAVSMEGTESTAAGVNPAPVRLIGQICGVLMVTAAMIHLGEVGMITLVVPYFVRFLVGADFKKVCSYSLLIGGCLLMVCRLVSSFIIIVDTTLPVTFILNIILTPAFMVIVAKQRRIFD
jgi:iron complex transport system permease protein